MWLDENFPHGGDVPSENDSNFGATTWAASKMPATFKESAAARTLNGLAEAYRYALKQAKEGNEVVNQATEIKLHILRPKFV